MKKAIATIIIAISLATAVLPAVLHYAAPAAVAEQMVWIPTKGGKKYHKKQSCSGMKNPAQVTISTAKSRGFTACKKCKP